MILMCSFRRVRYSSLSKNPINSVAAFLRIPQTTSKHSVLIRRRPNSTRSLSQTESTDSPASSERQWPVYAWNDAAVESLEHYGPNGGYHPVHIGDIFSAGRYEVIHKLGNGSYSTVWLCKDIPQQRYVSVKVTVSESEFDSAEQTRNESKAFQALRNGDPRHPGKRFVIHLLDEFIINGPNGRHQCFVLPVALNSLKTAKGASVSDNSLFPPQVARSIATQALLAVSYIHSCGIIHGGMLINSTLTVS